MSLAADADAEITDAFRQAAYATVALRQGLPLAEIAEGADARTFAALRSETPEWFAAAAGRASGLDAIAPELQPEALSGDVDWDLIRMYAPELQDADDGMAETPAPPSTSSTVPGSVRPQAPAADGNIRMDLLAELRDIDE